MNLNCYILLLLNTNPEPSVKWFKSYSFTVSGPRMCCSSAGGRAINLQDKTHFISCLHGSVNGEGVAGFQRIGVDVIWNRYLVEIVCAETFPQKKNACGCVQFHWLEWFQVFHWRPERRWWDWGPWLSLLLQLNSTWQVSLQAIGIGSHVATLFERSENWPAVHD